MPPTRILYFCHDNPKPSGGIRTIYEHVNILNRHSIPAFVVHASPTFKPTWFAAHTPTLYYQPSIQIFPSDIILLPEDLDIAPQLKNCPSRKVLFCQNHFYSFTSLPPGETWQTLGFTKVLASSDVIASFFRDTLNWPAPPVVHYAIDQTLFKPAPKKLQIACMPRKSQFEANFICGTFSATSPHAHKVQWIPIDGVPIQQVAATLAESPIFLSLSILEGLGLPPLEAMASGCAVVGYHGYGGLEFATPANGFWCEEGNPLSCVNMLHKVVALTLANDPNLTRIIQTGQQTAATYTPQRQEQELLQFINTLLNQQ